MKTNLPSRVARRFGQNTLLKVFACLLLVGGLCPAAHAASIGPDDYGYMASDVPYAFEDISATGTNTLASVDDLTISIPIGFSFSFYGASYTSLSYSPNGLITFGGLNGSFGNIDLNSGAPVGDLPSVAVLWDDWYAAPGAVFYQTLGTPGTRRLVIQWHNITECCSGFATNTVTFQAVLYETSGVLKFQYADTTTVPFKTAGVSATVGIRDTGGNANGRVLQWSVNSPVIANGQAIQFRPGHRIGPDWYGYTASDNTAYAFEDISGTGAAVLGGSDDGVTTVPIGFSFNFYGTNYTDAGLSVNGLVSFGGLNSQFSNQDITSANTPTGNLPSVAVLWDDWFASPGAIFYQTLGVPPDRRFIVQWNQIRSFNYGVTASNVTFQVIFYEANHCIKIQYSDVDVADGSIVTLGGSATVGIRDRSGHQNGRNLQWSFNQPGLCDGQAILFSPWGVGKVAVFGAPSVVGWNDDVQSQIALRMTNIQVDKFLVRPGDPVPTLAQLIQYRSVLVYSDAPFNDEVAVGNVLADYVDAGGGVVLATFAYNDSGDGIQGRLKTGGYLPFTTGGQSSGSPLSLVPTLTSHPALNGVASFSGGSSYHNTVATNVGSELVATWSNGQPLVGTKGITLGRVVGLNFYPPSSAVDPSFWTASTDGGLLMANALKYAGARTRVVSVFDDPAIVDTVNNSSAESDNVQASLRRLGFTATTFTDITAATTTNKILLFPDQEIAALGPVLSAGNQAALSNFVARGGLMILHGSQFKRGSNLLERVFGFTVVETEQTGVGPTNTLNGPAAAGTAFADDPATLPFNNGSSTLLASSLPAGSKSIYQIAGSNLVSIIPFGGGKIIYLGFDWFDAAPVGTQDGGWLQVLASAVTEADALRPSTLATINTTDKGWYNVSGDHGPANANYVVGDADGSTYRNFFVFNIPVLTGTPLAAELRLNRYDASSPDPTENYELRAVSTPIATLLAGGSGLTAIYNDLGDGTLYGGRTVALSETSPLTIPLNAAFLAALSSGGQIALGGQLTSIVPGGSAEYFFGSSGFAPADAQLILTLDPTHLPAFKVRVQVLPPNALQVSWPVTPDVWQLQSSPSLSSPVWTLVPDAPVIIGSEKVVVLPATDGQLFFRLVQAP